MLSNNLKYLRTRKKLTQSEFAKIIGVARTTYAMYEQGNREPDYDTLIKIADYFDVTTDYLLGREPSTQHQKPKQTSLFSYEAIGIAPEEFEKLTVYQQEVIEWAASENGPSFLNKSDNILDMMERLEIAYEVDRVMQERKKKK